MEINGSPLRDETGKQIGGVIVFRDISAWRKAQDAIRHLSSVVEQTADSVIITDKSGKIEYVNPAFEVTTGYSSEEALGETPRILRSGRHDEDHYK